jgi:phage tail-like protein
VSTPERKYPYVAQRFAVEIEGLVVAGFAECSGLGAEVELEEIQAGGENRYRIRLPKGTKYGNLILKRGLTDSKVLWDWHREVVKGTVKRKNVSVIVWDGSSRQNERWRWQFLGAFPVKWSGPELKADGNTVAIEVLELAHNGLGDVTVPK